MKKIMQDYLPLSISLLILIFAVRFFEMLYINSAFDLPPHTWNFELEGLLFDLLFAIKIMAILLIPYAMIYLVKPVGAKWFFILSGTLIVLISVVLSFYFGTAKVPLGADLFGYSFQEISSTTKAAGSINGVSILIFFLFGALSVFVFLKLKFTVKKDFVLYTLYVVFILVLVFGSFGTAHFRNEFDTFTASNKAGFLAESLINKYKQNHNNVSNTDLSQINKDFKKGYDFEYTSKEYPFLHKFNTPDLLGPLFNKQKEQPTIVFIVVESLGRAYSGDGAYLGSFTPFLDSLEQHSLYWENMLSTSGRTFSVLPSLLGSLPFGEKGFCEMGEKMPQAQSLICLLKPYGYKSSFYYGGDANFDNMGLFLKKQKIDLISDKADFGSGYEKLPEKADGFSWGYGDKATFKKYLADLNNKPVGPRIDIILTLSMHSPFLIKEQDLYNAKFDKRLAQLNLKADKKEYNKLYKAQFATMLYFDDALRGFIKEYAKRKDFGNTIFIITGDHRMPEIPISTQLDRFHVPLVIWSPMIKSPRFIKSVSTHFDLLPSLLAFLQNKYKMKFPSIVSFIGHGLDLEPSFRNIHSYPLMRNKNELMDYISGEFFLSGSDLYQVYPTLDIEPVTNEQQQIKLKHQFDLFRIMNIKATGSQRLLPDSLKTIKN
jgi:phosphoglycerol transferase MdoB-like AlkP superfamily enzyme